MKAERHIEGYAVSPVVSLLMRGRGRVVDNWGKGPHQDCYSGPVCAIEALFVEGMPADNGIRHLFESLPDGFGAVSKYNDRPTTTKADILSLYDRAIAMAIGESR